VVLLDAKMPGMDGFAVAGEIAVHPELGAATIMMLTSSGRFGDASRCRALNIRGYLTKPIRQTDLFDAITHTVRPSPERHADPRRTPGTLPFIRARVLLVEDNLVNQRVAVGLLTRRGHEVQVANNGLEGLSALDSSPFDVVLMDIQMLEMGGVEATRKIREREAGSGRRTRIVAMTAHAMKGDRERYIASGMDGYLAKPVDQAELFAAVEWQPQPAASGVEIMPLPAAPVDFVEMHERLGDDELIAEVIEMFLADYPVRLAEIGVAVAARDGEAIRSACHALKGAAGNLAAGPVVQHASALETLGAAEPIDAAAVDAAWIALQADGARLVSALRAAPVLSRGAGR
jgi:two-component system sensor histidine kinase/response regulator